MKNTTEQLRHALVELSSRVHNGYDFNSDPDNITLTVGNALAASSPASKDAPLHVEVTENRLLISIGIGTLASCATPENTGPLEGCRVEPGREEEWAKDVAEEIEREGEDGQTPLSSFLDGMMKEAESMGSAALIYDETPCSGTEDDDGGE